MAKTIKVNCNGPNKHFNEVDIDKLLQPVETIRLFGWSRRKPPELPRRYVLNCRHCAQGRVIVLPEMIEEHKKPD